MTANKVLGLADLASLPCGPLPKGTRPMTRSAMTRHLGTLPGWRRQAETIHKTFEFRDFYRTMAFVNAVAWIAHDADHHPDLTVSYGRCRVAYHTHSVGGLSINDFICAARIENLFTQAHSAIQRGRDGDR